MRPDMPSSAPGQVLPIILLAAYSRLPCRDPHDPDGRGNDIRREFLEIQYVSRYSSGSTCAE
jgi:hypothetical protein